MLEGGFTSCFGEDEAVSVRVLLNNDVALLLQRQHHRLSDFVTGVRNESIDLGHGQLVLNAQDLQYEEGLFVQFLVLQQIVQESH